MESSETELYFQDVSFFLDLTLGVNNTINIKKF